MHRRGGRARREGEDGGQAMLVWKVVGGGHFRSKGRPALLEGEQVMIFKGGNVGLYVCYVP